MPGGFLPEVVFLELESLAVALLENFVPDDNVHGIGQEIRHAVAREVDHPGCLDVARAVDFVVGPGRACLPGVFNPADVLAKVRACEEVSISIAVHVKRQGGEIVVVRADTRDFANRKGLPVWGLVPARARDDVDLAVVINVKDAGGLELALPVDRVDFPPWLVGPQRRPRKRTKGPSRRAPILIRSWF